MSPLFYLLSLILWTEHATGFVVPRHPKGAHWQPRLWMAQVELISEPDGGEEMLAPTSMPGCRMKKMEERSDLKGEDGIIYKFWMTAEADGNLIKEYRAQILKDASKKANFPGFRKGQIPPYAQPQITQFAIQEAIIKTVSSAAEAYGLKTLKGSDGEVTVNEDVKEMSRGYKVGDSLQFTATLNCAFNPVITVDTASIADPIDAEVSIRN